MISLEGAYEIACRQVGEAHVQIELLTRELEKVTAERDEAAEKLAALAREPVTD